MNANDLIYLHGSTMTGVHSDSSSSNFSATNISRRLALPPTHMEIQLDNHFHAKVYTSGQSVTGHVTIVPQRDVPFDTFDIVLLGTTRTQIDSLGMPAASTHIFLKLSMPIPEDAYPVPRVLEAGRSYSLPIYFVIPAHLTLGACNHAVDTPHVHEHHVRLPPTLGVGSGWPHDDLAPEMACVQYAIKARVYREGAEPGLPAVKIVEATHPIRVLPASLEDPPLALTKHDRSYKTAKAKTLRKGFLNGVPLLRAAGGKLGCLRAEACAPQLGAPQPAPFVLRPDGRAAQPTTAYVQLFFQPASPDVPPPRITAVAGKLTAHTYYSATSIPCFPNLGDWMRQEGNGAGAGSSTGVGLRRGVYSTSVPLFSRAVHDFQWSAQIDAVRRDSGYCSDSDERSGSDGAGEAAAGPSSPQHGSHHNRLPSPTSSRKSPEPGLSYAAQVVVPVALPLDKKMFVPTFHSCIASRTYTLHLTISVAPGSAAAGYSGSGRRKSRTEGLVAAAAASSPTATTHLTLSLPVQVVVGDEGLLLAEQADTLPSFEAALEEAEADAHLRPRLMSVPDEQFQGTSVLPGYPGSR